jgi:hypothetical protein
MRKKMRLADFIEKLNKMMENGEATSDTPVCIGVYNEMFSEMDYISADSTIAHALSEPCDIDEEFVLIDGVIK